MFSAQSCQTNHYQDIATFSVQDEKFKALMLQARPQHQRTHTNGTIPKNCHATIARFQKLVLGYREIKLFLVVI
jgi:hypothetical protein